MPIITRLTTRVGRIPRDARAATGDLATTVYFYKELDGQYSR